jgi:hypothetical protein
VHSALCGAVFCLDFDPLFFLLLLPCQVFFLYLFIYLFNKLGCNKGIIGGQNGRHQCFFPLILANSLFSFPLNKQGAATKHLKTRQLFYCFSLFSFQQTNKGIHLPHTPLDRGPTNSQAHITQLEIFYLFISLSVE